MRELLVVLHMAGLLGALFLVGVDEDLWPLWMGVAFLVAILFAVRVV